MSSLTPTAVLSGVIAIASGGGEPVLEDITVKSGATQQTVVAGEGYDAIGEVTVEPVALQDKIISSIGLGVQRYTADQGYDGLGQLTVNASFREMHAPQNMTVDSGEIWLFAPDSFAPVNYDKVRFKNSLGVDQQVYTAGDGGYDFTLYPNGQAITIPQMMFRNQTGMQSFTTTSEWQSVTVGSQAFDGCTGLKRVEIKALSSIQSDAFNGCSSVEDYYFGPGSPGSTTIPSLSSTSAIRGKSTFRIHVPADLEASWKAATNWSNLASRIVGDYEV